MFYRKKLFPRKIFLVSLITGLLTPICYAQNNLEGADYQAKKILKNLTLDEKLSLVSFSFKDSLSKKNGAVGSAGYVAGIKSKNIPALQITDASLGIANPTLISDDIVTALPSSIALGATFDSSNAYHGGKMIGKQAKEKGFNMLLAGGADVIRDPLNGRNFEYISEDPLLTAELVSESIKGIQSMGVLSSIKHFAVNTQETGRVLVSSDLDEGPMRNNDLLAFQLAIEKSHPAAVMPGYNRINGEWATENNFLINHVLKGNWNYPGWVISDWGATHSTIKSANAGLDQEAAYDLDTEHFFGEPLKNAIKDGKVSNQRLNDMVLRILRQMINITEMRPPVQSTVKNIESDNLVAQKEAEESLVLLKNEDDILPLKTTQRIAVIGGHADKGVLSGGGSSQVIPKGSFQTYELTARDSFTPKTWYHPSSPLQALKAQSPTSTFSFSSGDSQEDAINAAKQADTVIYFATQWTAESVDVKSLDLPHHQNELISKLAQENKNIIVVLETGGPILMPWIDKVKGVVEAWYPGSRGGEAIASVLTGKVSPSGHLPVTFAKSASQLPKFDRPDPASTTSNPGQPIKGGLIKTNYNEQGDNIGYRWFEEKGTKPLFPFGYGLSYTSFSQSNLQATVNHDTLTLSLDIKNTGHRTAKALAQFYIRPVQGNKTSRLAGFQKIEIPSTETRHVSVTVDPRIIGYWDTTEHKWKIDEGEYEIRAANDALSPGLNTIVKISGKTFDDQQVSMLAQSQ